MIEAQRQQPGAPNAALEIGQTVPFGRQRVQPHHAG
jgi:hypothetical protein